MCQVFYYCPFFSPVKIVFLALSMVLGADIDMKIRVDTKMRVAYLALVVLSVVSCAQAFLPSGFFATGNTLWDELYLKCGHRVTFHCVQSRLMDYVNNTLDSDLRLAEGIYFVKQHRTVHRVLDANSSPLEVGIDPLDEGNSTDVAAVLKRSQRALKTPFSHAGDNGLGSSNSSSSDNGDSSSTDADELLKTEEEEDDAAFTNFVHTVERIEEDLESKPTEEGSSNATTTTESTVPANGTESENVEESRSDNVVVRSLHKVTDLLYDKTTAYLTSHDLHLDMPQMLFGDSRIVVSPRGFDEDGGILLKLNFNPAETPRSGGIGKYFRK